MTRRARSRDLAMAYYRLVRALRTGTTIADPRRPEPRYVTLDMLRREFAALAAAMTRRQRSQPKSLQATTPKRSPTRTLTPTGFSSRKSTRSPARRHRRRRRRPRRWPNWTLLSGRRRLPGTPPARTGRPDPDFPSTGPQAQRHHPGLRPGIRQRHAASLPHRQQRFRKNRTAQDGPRSPTALSRRRPQAVSPRGAAPVTARPVVPSHYARRLCNPFLSPGRTGTEVRSAPPALRRTSLAPPTFCLSVVS